MYKSRILRGFANKLLLPVFKKMGLRPESLVIFRIFFALLTIFAIIKLDFIAAAILLTIYQFVFLVDYVDGALARHYGIFSVRWNVFDRAAHYIVSALFLLAVTLSVEKSGLIFNIGVLGSSFILLNLLIEQAWMLKKKVVLDDLRGKPDEQGVVAPIYSFLPIDGSFTFFYFLFLFKAFTTILIFFSLLYFATFIKKIFTLIKNG